MNLVLPPRIRSCPIPSVILRVCLCLALIIIGAQGAFACDGQGALRRVVLCSHGAAEVVWLDATGKPVMPKAPNCANCPDCLSASAVAVLPGASEAPQMMWASHAASPIVPAVLNPILASVDHLARGPPCAAQE